MIKNDQIAAKCDKCLKAINEKDGYLNYSVGYDRIMRGYIDEIGCLLYCDKCIKQVYSKNNFSQICYFVSDDNSTIDKFGNNTINLVKIAQIRGYTPDQAIDKAKELAGIWWNNKTKGAQMAEQHAKLTLGMYDKTIHPKKWWQFWKK